MGDTVMTTNNPVLLRNTRKERAIVCVQKSSTKIKCDEDSFIAADKLSFGDEIGAVTNRVTAMYDVQSNFEKGSKEYDEVQFRIWTGQNYQQNAIKSLWH